MQRLLLLFFPCYAGIQPLFAKAEDIYKARDCTSSPGGPLTCCALFPEGDGKSTAHCSLLLSRQRKTVESQRL